MSRNIRSRTRREILDAASRLFAVAGFKGTSLQDIAAEVGCSKATLLYHFDGKDAILVEMLAPAVGAFDMLDKQLAGLADDTVQFAAVKGYVDLVLRFRREITVLYGDIPALLEHPALADVQGMVDRLLDALAARSSEPPAQVTALMVLGAVPVVCMKPAAMDDDELRDVLVRSAAGTLNVRGA
ncbi:TetR/AcrR family transcriptional regulator [Streptosporangium lutulentum]|uniref:AcrR family transcriptional regulator n=1 Tax=Streptosporangium lutulentum TaxID=1461250 RepID=A0ABT9Q5V2_9ACTN|nr:TetR/AcrR family transcriptional regulator [Streptosporangium lutulentum]MDP9842067.1 AcrR family transcriptional regulator [Streptosporangium lutulentum]